MKRINSIIILMLLLCCSCKESNNRQVINFGSGWQFVQKDVGVGGKAAEWKKVYIPHTWNDKDTQVDQLVNTKKVGEFYRGACWYRKSFETPSGFSGKRVFIKFEGVSIVADVYLNGKVVGSHKGAFGAFSFELTDFLKYGELNILEVKVDNSPSRDIAPLSGDFNMFGGIYRPVTLIITNSMCITPLDHATSGVYITQKSVSKKRATISVLTKLDRRLPSNKNIQLKTVVKDRQNRIVAEKSSNCDFTKNCLEVVEELEIAEPHLWHGIKDPYLYTVTVSLIENGKCIDEIVEPLGLRFYHVDPEKGFFLNGEHFPLHGVNRHQDYEDKGWAISESDHELDHGFITEMGANCIRLAHYPQSSYFYSLCDKGGQAVWAEIPLVNEITASKQFSDNIKLQLVEMIRQHYNHPSIFFWGLWNEIPNKNTANPVELVRELNEIAHKEDPVRPTIAGSNNKVYRVKDLRQHTDLFAWNLYPGWYGGKPGDMGKWIDQRRNFTREKGGCLSEYGAGGSIKQHQQDNLKAPNPGGEWHPEEWQAYAHEEQYRELVKRPWIWGTFVWNMFDFCSYGRTEGDRYGINDKGLVTHDRKVRKDAFYFYKANWSKEDVLYITSRRHVERKKALTNVKVYTNASSAVLFVNGKKYGSKKTSEMHVVTWDGIVLDKGNNLIKVTAQRNGKTITDSCVWICK